MRTETAEMSNNKELGGFPCWVCASRGEEMRFLDITARARHMDLLHAPEYVGEPGADELFDSGYLSTLRNHPSKFQDNGKYFDFAFLKNISSNFGKLKTKVEQSQFL